MVKASTKERRAFPRAKRVLSIQYRLVQSKRKDVDTKWHLSTTQDMSYGGLSFYTDVEFRTDETLEIHVVMSGILDIYKGLAKVVRVEKKKTGSYFFIGVKFEEKRTSPRFAKSYKDTPSANPPQRKRSLKRV